MNKYFLVLLVLCSCISPVRAQNEDSMLDDIKDSVITTHYITNAFKSTRIINGQSIEMLGAGSLDFRILHRFGLISQGIGQLFGLDQATTRLSFDFAPTKDILLGFGRSSAKKELDADVKYRLIQQSEGARVMPVSVILVSGITCQTLPFEDTSRMNYFSSRLGYVNQVIIGSKLSESISLQLSPMLIHRNLVDFVTDEHDIFAVGGAGRIKLTNRVALMFEYHHAFTGRTIAPYDPLSIGIDIETGGHVFQVHVTNAVGMNERAFVTETTNNWLKGEIQLGFNISRVFQL